MMHFKFNCIKHVSTIHCICNIFVLLNKQTLQHNSIIYHATLALKHYLHLEKLTLVRTYKLKCNRNKSRYHFFLNDHSLYTTIISDEFHAWYHVFAPIKPAEMAEISRLMVWIPLWPIIFHSVVCHFRKNIWKVL